MVRCWVGAGVIGRLSGDGRYPVVARRSGCGDGGMDDGEGAGSGRIVDGNALHLQRFPIVISSFVVKEV
jgi:hypothetical protein